MLYRQPNVYIDKKAFDSVIQSFVYYKGFVIFR